MEKLNLWKITGQSEDDRDTEVIQKLEQTNPPLADALKKGLARVAENSAKKKDQIVITDAMRKGAAAHDFQAHKQLGNDY